MAESRVPVPSTQRRGLWPQIQLRYQLRQYSSSIRLGREMAKTRAAVPVGYVRIRMVEDLGSGMRRHYCKAQGAEPY